MSVNDNSRRTIVAAFTGLLVGALLFLLCNVFESDFRRLQLFEALLFLTGIAMATIFPSAWLWAALGVAIATSLTAAIQTALQIARDPTCCNLWPIGLVMWSFLGIPAPLLGGFAGRLLRRALSG